MTQEEFFERFLKLTGVDFDSKMHEKEVDKLLDTMYLETGYMKWDSWCIIHYIEKNLERCRRIINRKTNEI